jgi:quinohemoprotein ethanol dehydrogenase
MQTFGRNRVTLLLTAVLTLTGIATVSAQQPVAVDAAILRKAGTPADQFPGSWLTYGKSQSETRYSPLKQIDASNVKRLGLEWSYVVGAGGYNQEGTPLVWNNTIYGITTNSVVYAVDARTGRQIWRWDPEVNQRSRGINANRGLALYNGRIFAPGIDGRLLALGCDYGQTRLGGPRRLAAGGILHNYGAPDCRRQSDHRGLGRRYYHSRFLRCV